MVMDKEKWMNSVDELPEEPVQPGEGSKHDLSSLKDRISEDMVEEGFEQVELPSFISKEAFNSFYDDSFPFFSSMHLSASRNILKPREADLDEVSSSLDEDDKQKIRSIIDSEKDPRKLLDKLVSEAGLLLPQAVKVVSLFFPKSRRGKKKILKGSMALSWLETVSVLSEKRTDSLFLFSFGRCFLPERPVFSFVISGGTSSQGKELASELFDSIEFEKKDFTDPCFVPGTEEKVLIKGEGAGRIGMIRGLDDPLFFFEVSLGSWSPLFPQFSREWEISDEEIAKAISEMKKPSTSWGKLLSKKIRETCNLYGDQKAPCEFKVFQKEVDDHQLEVWVKKEEEGTLCGPAFLNEIYVYEGNVLSLPPSGGGEEKKLVKKARREGVKAGVSLLESFSDRVAARVEENPIEEQEVKVDRVVFSEEVNIGVPETIRRYTKDKVFEVGGELGITVETRVEKLWTHEQP